jgi:hypothetical protein
VKKYEYKVILIKVDRIWTGRAESDYLVALSEHAKDGWRFAGFVPPILNPKGVKGQEILLERELREY